MPFMFPWEKLPGTATEKEYLAHRMPKLTIEEQYMLEGALQIDPAKTAADLINITEQFHKFQYFHKVLNDQELGAKLLKDFAPPWKTNQSLYQYFDTIKIGQDHRQSHGGVMTSHGYVECSADYKKIYTRAGPIPEDLTWFLRAKIASKHCPEGVWRREPEFNFCIDYYDDILQLDEDNYEQPSILEAECRLPCIKNPAGYEDGSWLFMDASYFCEEYERQSKYRPFLKEHLLAALEFESCTYLADAYDILLELRCYDFVPPEPLWEQYGRMLLEEWDVSLNDLLAQHFDFAAYVKAEIEKKEFVPCATGYIARNALEPRSDYYLIKAESRQEDPANSAMQSFDS